MTDPVRPPTAVASASSTAPLTPVPGPPSGASAPPAQRVTQPVVRRAARVILLDEADRVLLFRGCDPHRPDRTFWLAPGGGIDHGETPEQCVARELREETGLADFELGPAVWTRRAVFSFAGTWYDQHETFFLARCRVFDVDTAGLSEVERQSMHEHRWWSCDDIAHSTDAFAPADLGDRLRELLCDGPPSSLVEVSGAVLP